MHAPCRALQGLLRKLGAGFDEALLGMGMGSGRFKGIITSLKSAEDEGTQLGALTELCELLSISSEDTLAAFPVESTVPLLVSVADIHDFYDVGLCLCFCRRSRHVSQQYTNYSYLASTDLSLKLKQCQLGSDTKYGSL